MSPQDPFPSSPIMESFEMTNQVGTFTEPVISPTTAEQGFDHSAGYFASPVAETRTWLQAPEVPENPVDHHSKQLEDPAQACPELIFSEPVANSGLNEDQSFVSETDATLKLPRYISEALYVADLHPLAIESVGYLMDLFSRVGNVSVVKVIPKPPGTPGIPSCSAFVNFHTVEDACRAWQTLNYHVWMGQPMRIMFSNLDPATRYNEDANIIVTDLEESIDSKFLHQRFCKLGAVVSSKVSVDPNGKSTGRAFIQFEDEIDAKRAIEVMNNEKIRGKKVYVGPFIRRKVHSEAEEMSKNPIDLNPAHNPHVEVAIPSQNLKNESLPIGKNESGDILLGSSSTSGKRSRDFRLGTSDSPAHGFLRVHSSSSGKTTSNATIQWRQGGREAKERERNLRRGTKASRNLARRRFFLRQEMIKERMSNSQIPVDLSKVLSSEPWPPQPWSVETLKDRLTKSQCPEERLAMLGATLFPLVARQTKTLVSDVTNVLVKLDIVEIERIMNLSEEALHQKVEEVKEDISERVPAFVPPTFVDVHEVAACVEEKHVILVEEFEDLPPLVPARAPTPTPAPAPSLTPAPTDPAPSVNFKEFVVPSFTGPVVPEFLQAPALPGLGLGIRVNIPLPSVSHPLVQPCFPDSVLNYTGYRPQPGTGFYEPRVRHHLGGLHCLVAALARAYLDHEDKDIAAEESADPMEELAHAERAQAVEEPGELMMEAFARVRLAQIVEESAEQMEEFAQEERAQAAEESAKQMEEFVQEERAQAVEESAEPMEEFTQEERAQAAEESAKQMEEVAEEERAQAVEESTELMEEVAHVERDRAVEKFAERKEAFAHEERVLTVEESTDRLEESAHEEQAEALEESAEIKEEVANVEQANQAPEESAELEEVANAEQANEALEGSAEHMQEVAHVEQANQALEESAELEEVADAEQANQALEGSAEHMQEVAHVEQANQVLEGSAELEEVANAEQANQALEGSAEHMQEVAHVEQANQALEGSAELEEVANAEQANQVLEGSAELMEEVVNEQAQAMEESAEPVEEVAHVERAQAVEEPAC